jgi:hypothetical protein
METIHSSEKLVNTDLHGATSQKTAFFIVTAVDTSNPTYLPAFTQSEYREEHKKIQINL